MTQLLWWTGMFAIFWFSVYCEYLETSWSLPLKLLVTKAMEGDFQCSTIFVYLGVFFTTSFTLVTARKIQQPFANQSLNTHFHQATACMKAGCEQPLSAGWRIISSTQLQCPFCVRLQKSRGALPSEVSQNSVLLCNRAVKRTKIKNYFRM